MTECLVDGPADAATSIFLAHGAGAPMDSEFMNGYSRALAARDIKVIRFEFPYMAARRKDGTRRPPPRAETLTAFFAELVISLNPPGRVIIGGKSMGGRIASLIVDDLLDKGAAAGAVCLGYPFHPPGKPHRLRTAHLETLRAPALICQGERDPFGSRDEVAAYTLSPTVRIEWLEDGNHDLVPRKASGHTEIANQARAIDAVVEFCRASAGR